MLQRNESISASDRATELDKPVLGHSRSLILFLASRLAPCVRWWNPGNGFFGELAQAFYHQMITADSRARGRSLRLIVAGGRDNPPVVRNSLIREVSALHTGNCRLDLLSFGTKGFPKRMWLLLV